MTDVKLELFKAINLHRNRIQAIPKVIVPFSIKEIFVELPNYVIENKIINRHANFGDSKRVKRMPSFSFNESEIKKSQTAKKNNISKHSSFLDEKLDVFMHAITKKSSFEERTILHSPLNKNKIEHFKFDSTVQGELNLMKFLKESVNTQTSFNKRKKKICEKGIIWDQKVHDIYDPEFSSENEEAEINNALADNLKSNSKTRHLTNFEEKLTINKLPSVHCDYQSLTNQSEQRTEEKFTIFSTKLAVKTSVLAPKTTHNPRKMTSFKKTSILDSGKNINIVRSPIFDRKSSLQKRTLVNLKEQSSKISIEKPLKRTKLLGDNKSIIIMRMIKNEKTVAAKIENNSVSRLLNTPSKMGRMTQMPESKFGNNRVQENVTFSKFLFGSKKNI